jgi:hypothetical protein
MARVFVLIHKSHGLLGLDDSLMDLVKPGVLLVMINERSISAGPPPIVLGAGPLRTKAMRMKGFPKPAFRTKP